MAMVINAGVPGNTTQQMLARLDAVLARQPDLVVLKAGTNDALNSAVLIPPERSAANLSAIADAILPRSRLLLVTPLPFHEPYLLARHRREAYGDLPPAARQQAAVGSVRALGAARGVPVVDAWRIFQGIGMVGEDPASLLRNQANSGAPDGVHPTAEGYRVLAAAVAQAVLAHALPHGRVACLGDSITFGQYVAGEGTATGETYPAGLARILAASRG